MEKMFNIFSILLGICGGVMGYLFGGSDILVVTLLCMTVLDYVTGVLNAYMQKKLSSNVGFKGIVKKVMIYIVVVCSVLLNRLLGGELPLREIVITFFIANEGLSLLENVSPYMPVPESLKKALLQLRENTVKKESNKNE